MVRAMEMAEDSTITKEIDITISKQMATDMQKVNKVMEDKETQVQALPVDVRYPAEGDLYT